MTLEYVSTGVPGVDKILGEKGIAKGHTILICGGPGSGKTTFAF
jgi:KaiC/GvpD/RAD55 family RecA-like ATPase